MPYCPKCDMEFIDGITVCTDCGGALMESEEAAKAAKAEEAAKLREAQVAAALAAMSRSKRTGDSSDSDSFILDDFNPGDFYPNDFNLDDFNLNDFNPDDFNPNDFDLDYSELDGSDLDDSDLDDSDLDDSSANRKPVPESPIAPAHLYVNKAQKYEDLKSSVSAFLIVGVILLAASVLFWTGMVNLPITGISKIIMLLALTVMGIGSLFVAMSSSKAAKALAPQIETEAQQTRDLIQWFTDTYTGESIDQSIPNADAMPPEELSLKRFSVIQDYLITSHDLPDQAYVDALSEEIYGMIYE